MDKRQRGEEDARGLDKQQVGWREQSGEGDGHENRAIGRRDSGISSVEEVGHRRRLNEGLPLGTPQRSEHPYSGGEITT